MLIRQGIRGISFLSRTCGAVSHYLTGSHFVGSVAVGRVASTVRHRRGDRNPVREGILIRMGVPIEDLHGNVDVHTKVRVVLGTIVEASAIPTVITRGGMVRSRVREVLT